MNCLVCIEIGVYTIKLCDLYVYVIRTYQVKEVLRFFMEPKLNVSIPGFWLVYKAYGEEWKATTDVSSQPGLMNTFKEHHLEGLDTIDGPCNMSYNSDSGLELDTSSDFTNSQESKTSSSSWSLDIKTPTTPLKCLSFGNS